jgi:hypothetical protein
LLAVDFREDLGLTAAEPVFLVLDRFAFPRLLADFLVARRLVAALPPAERFAFARFLAGPLDVAFFLVERRFPR